MIRVKKIPSTPTTTSTWPLTSIPCSGGEAEYTQYVITRKSSEFGSAYKASGIQNGDMLVWHDASGRNTTDYPYLSYTDTGDPSRGRDYIGADLDENGNYCKRTSQG